MFCDKIYKWNILHTTSASKNKTFCFISSSKHIQERTMTGPVLTEKSLCEISFPAHSYCHSTFHRKCHSWVLSKISFLLFNLFCFISKNQGFKQKKNIFGHMNDVSCFQEYVIFQNSSLSSRITMGTSGHLCI